MSPIEDSVDIMDTGTNIRDLTVRHDSRSISFYLVFLCDLMDNQLHFLRHLLKVGVGGFHVNDG